MYALCLASRTSFMPAKSPGVLTTACAYRAHAIVLEASCGILRLLPRSTIYRTRLEDAVCAPCRSVYISNLRSAHTAFLHFRVTTVCLGEEPSTHAHYAAGSISRPTPRGPKLPPMRMLLYGRVQEIVKEPMGGAGRAFCSWSLIIGGTVPEVPCAAARGSDKLNADKRSL